MIPIPFPNQRFMQACWVVPDIHAAIDAWVTSCGVGPFFLFETVPVVDPVYRGQPVEPLDITAAMAQAGDIQVELVCQNEDKPSFWREVVPAGQSGLHHLALYCQDYDAELAAYTNAGAEVVYSIKMMGARTCWVDTTKKLGFMVELIEANSIADSVFEQFRAAAMNWDGANPVRTLS